MLVGATMMPLSPLTPCFAAPLIDRHDAMPHAIFTRCFRYAELVIFLRRLLLVCCRYEDARQRFDCFIYTLLTYIRAAIY